MDWIVIMAGGGGTRLWPLSRRRRPKQFLSLLEGGETLIGATVKRTSAVAPIERTLVVTAASQVDEVRRALPHLPVENIIAEPEARNTAPCIGLATVEVLRRDERATIGVLPSDHFIPDVEPFVASVREAMRVAERGHIVTVGIRPAHPETGYGYIQASAAALPGDLAAENARTRFVERFVEKPDRATAERYLASGDFYWNAGMFFFAAKRMRREIALHMPALGEILDGIERDPARAEELYPRSPAKSIDYGVMEKLGARELFVVEGDFRWNDVGSFAALADVRLRDEGGNAITGEAITIDARENVVVSDGKRVVAAVGVEGLVIVATDDAVLVIPRDRAQDVRRVVDALASGKRDPYL